MKKLHIFKRGTHTDSGGKTLEFSDDIINNVVESYDPQLHEAPLVVGHPATDDPAMGWVETLQYDDGGLHATPKQVNPKFSEQVKEGAFKKISASFYMPEAPNNPSPGNWYLRHVGFLGAQAPAVKGLKAIEFNEAEQGVVNFEDSFETGASISTLASLVQNIKKFIIKKSSIEEADDLIPDYMVKELERSADRQMNPQPQFNEDTNMDLEQAKAKIAALEADNDSLTKENGTLKDQVASFEEAQAQAAAEAKKATIAASVEDLVKKGHIAPAEREQVTAFCELLDDTDKTMEFGEGDDKVTVSGHASLINYLKTKRAVNFEEESADGNADKKPLTAAEMSQRALAYQEEQKAAGVHVDLVAAVNHVSQQAE